MKASALILVFALALGMVSGLATASLAGGAQLDWRCPDCDCCVNCIGCLTGECCVDGVCGECCLTGECCDGDCCDGDCSDCCADEE